MAYDYETLDFEHVLPSGQGGGFTGTGQLGFQAQPPQMDFGYNRDTGGYTPIDFGAITQGAGGGGFQFPAGGIAEIPGLQAPSPVQLPGGLPSIRNADTYTGAGFRPSQLGLGYNPATGDYTSIASRTGQSSQQPPAEPSLLKRAVSGIEEAGAYLDKNKFLARLLGGGLTAGVGAIMGGGGQQAATRLQSDLAKLGATQRQQGQALVAAAQRGELTAPQLQQLEAFRAQQAQALASRGLLGGTAEQQLSGQVENMRQQLLQQNLQQGLQLLQIGDAYTQQAITAGYNASQNAQQTAANFYNQALRTFGGESDQKPYVITRMPATPAATPGA